MLTTRSTLLNHAANPNDQAAWRELAELYRPLLLRYARDLRLGAEDAEDVAQECLMVLRAELPRSGYKPERGRFRSWLRAMVRNKIIDQARKPQPRSMAAACLEQLEAENAGPDAIWDRDWRMAHLRYCLDRLKAELQPQAFEAFTQYALNEQPATEVAAALGWTVNQVYLAKSRTLLRLREMMGELFGDEGADY